MYLVLSKILKKVESERKRVWEGRLFTVRDETKLSHVLKQGRRQTFSDITYFVKEDI